MYSSLSLAFPAHETFVTKVILGDDYLAGLSDLSTSTQREVDDKEISAKAGWRFCELGLLSRPSSS